VTIKLEVEDEAGAGLSDPQRGYTLNSDGKRSVEYAAWWNMMQRCYTPQAKGYEKNGGAVPQVTVCDAWRASFPQFLSDVGRRPAGTTILARTGEHYGPGEVIWLSRSDYARLKKGVHWIKYLNTTMLLCDWAARLEMPVSVLSHRVNGLGWGYVRALTTPYVPMAPRNVKRLPT
jgi:hypothetical protein